jgi:hypothetical protein
VLPTFQVQGAAVDRVERLLHRVTEALDAAGIDYAVIGGNAVAAWVGTVDEGAVRATKDVDLLIRRQEMTRIAEVLASLNFDPLEVLGVYMFVDRDRPSPRTGVHLVFAGEKIRAHYAHPAPDPRHSLRSKEGFRVLELVELVKMKLQAHRFIDRAHILDLHGVGLLTADIVAQLPEDLRGRLAAIFGEAENG